MGRSLQLIWVFTCSIAFSAFAEVIPIILKGDAATALWPMPVRCGVPFPRGTLALDAPVTLVNGEGESQLFQHMTTATWNADGSDGIRWLLIDFLADRGQSYALHTGDDAATSQQAAPLAVAENGRISVDTGALSTTCDGQRFDVFGAVYAKRGGQQMSVFGGTAGNPDALALEDETVEKWTGPYVVHETRGLFRADLDPNAQITLEETGPIHSVIKADGQYTNDNGETFCRFSCRVHFYKGRADIRLEHTFIFTGDSKVDRIRDIGIELPLLGERPKQHLTMFGHMVGPEHMQPYVVENSNAHLYQVMDSPDARRFEWHTYDATAGKRLATGEKAAGWMQVRTTDASLMVVIKDAWQQYPFELEWEDTTARVHLWPRHGRLWDTSFDGMWHHLNEQQKRHMTAQKPKVGANNVDRILSKLRRSSATGAAKTHDVWLFMNPSGHWDGVSQMYWNQVQKPVYAHADLAWQCRSQALDHLPHHPRDDQNFPDTEAYLQTMLDLMQKHVDTVHYYGWWDWGAYHEHMYLSEFLHEHQLRYGGNHHGNTAHQPNWHRAKPKSHYYWGSFPWMMYFRTGEPRWLDYAKRYTRYSADRAFVHHSTGDGRRIAGEEYHYDNSEIHWLGGWYGAPGGSQVCANLCDRDDYIYQYWLTGERRAWDVLQMWGQQYEAHITNNGNHLKMLVDGGLYGNWTRNIGGALNRLSSYYMATWKPAFLEYAKTLADAALEVDYRESLTKKLRDTPPEPRSTVNNIWYSNWLYEGLFRYHQASGDQRVRDLLATACRAGGDISVGAHKPHTLNWAIYGFATTADLFYLNLGRTAIDREVSAWVRRHSFRAGGTKFRVVSMPRMLGAMANAPAAWRAQNLPLHRQGVTADLLYFHPDAKQFAHWPNGSQAVYFNDPNDRAFEVVFTAFRGGRFALFAPNGEKVAQTDMLDVYTSRLARLAAPQDQQSGTYTLRCVEQEPNFHSKRQDMPSVLTVLHCDLQGLVYPYGQRLTHIPEFSARAWYFAVPANTQGASAAWRPASFEAAGQRHFTVEAVDGSFAQNSAALSARNLYDGRQFSASEVFVFELPTVAKRQVYRCEPEHRAGSVLSRRIHSYPAGFQLTGVPAYVATHPNALFIPKLPASYAMRDGK